MTDQDALTLTVWGELFPAIRTLRLDVGQRLFWGLAQFQSAMGLHPHIL